MKKYLIQFPMPIKNLSILSNYLLLSLMVILCFSVPYSAHAGGSSIGLKEIASSSNEHLIAGQPDQLLFSFNTTLYNNELPKFQISNIDITCGPHDYFDEVVIKENDKELGRFPFQSSTDGQLAHVSFGDSFLTPYESKDYSIYLDVKESQKVRAGVCRLGNFAFKELTMGFSTSGLSVEYFAQDRFPFVVTPADEDSLLRPGLDIEWNTIVLPEYESDDIPTLYDNPLLDFTVSADEDLVIDDVFFSCKKYPALTKFQLRAKTVRDSQSDKVSIQNNVPIDFLSVDQYSVQSTIFSDLDFHIQKGEEANLEIVGDFTSKSYAYTGNPDCYVTAINSHRNDDKNYTYYPKTGQPVSLRAQKSNQQTVDSFSDIDQEHNHYESIDYLRRNAIVSGYPDGSFQPLSMVNRAELAKMLTNSRGIYSQDEPFYVQYHSPESCFNDVSPYRWYTGYICLATSREWVDGHPDNTFRADLGVNRAEAIKMILDAHEVPLSSFDGTVDDEWYDQYVPAASALGLLYNDPQLESPGEMLTREELSQMIYLTHMWLDEHKYDEFFEGDENFMNMMDKVHEQKGDNFVERVTPSQWRSVVIASDFTLKCDKEAFQALDSISDTLNDQQAHTDSWTTRKMHFWNWIHDEVLLSDIIFFEFDPFHVAVNSGCLDIAEEYIKDGADIDSALGFAGNAPLHLAVEKLDLYMVNLLLENDADPNVLTTLGEPLPGDGFTNYTVSANVSPLLLAILNADLDIAELLLENGADPNITISTPPCTGWAGYSSSGCSPLDVASLLNDEAMVKLLEDYGATESLES